MSWCAPERELKAAKNLALPSRDRTGSVEFGEGTGVRRHLGC
jgi:hypothetical protein